MNRACVYVPEPHVLIWNLSFITKDAEMEYLPEYCAAFRVTISRAEETAQLVKRPWCKHGDLNSASGPSCKKLMCTCSWKIKGIKGSRTLPVYQKTSHHLGNCGFQRLPDNKADLILEPWVPVRDPDSKTEGWFLGLTSGHRIQVYPPSCTPISTDHQFFDVGSQRLLRNTVLTLLSLH